ncbi:leucine-rich repeat neuronal protein 3 [Episyrphus balteatus]|uniref:leucine-rich repeat neuronal protein 3 n=1 Tax=Episyrphus balteatus TaxID=286459 RepID=UPI0024855A52|nr:leucine-rich repeat neuronal protein 3 [Episyrphus balteatus]
MKFKVFLAFLVGVISIASINGADTNATVTPVTSTTVPTTIATTTTTVKPVVITKDSLLCKRCSCIIDILELNCNNKSMTQWFNDDEWNTITNGNVQFITLRMEHNNLTNIPPLKPASVQNLYLGHNLINRIETAAFRNFINLTILDLSYNNLTTKSLRPEVFQGNYNAQNYQPMANLKQLDLGHNALHSLDADVFEHFPILEILNLGSNQFQVMDHQTEVAITGLVHLKTLDLSYMELKDLPDNLLHAPRDLENLILTGNLLDEVPDGIDRAVNLKSLTFDENLLVNLEKENVFPKMPKLEFLSISYSADLAKIGAGAFSNLQGLKKIQLSDNPKLSYIDPKAFANATVNPLIFDYPTLEELNLHNNNLTHLDHDLFERWDKIKSIDLRRNPWNCDSDNSWLIHTLMTQINETSPLLVKDVVCGAPSAWKSKQLSELNHDKNILRCESDSDTSSDGRLLIGLLIGLFVGIPISLGAVLAYRRGYFGLLFNRGHTGQSLYNRASFQDDFHI